MRAWCRSDPKFVYVNGNLYKFSLAVDRSDKWGIDAIVLEITAPSGWAEFKNEDQKMFGTIPSLSIKTGEFFARVHIVGSFRTAHYVATLDDNGEQFMGVGCVNGGWFNLERVTGEDG